MSILWHARKHGIRPGMFCRKHTFYAIQLTGSGTQYNAYLQYQGTDYDVIHAYVKCTQKFRANRPILMTRVAVAFIFSSFWLKFFVQHSVFAGEGEMRRFFLHRTKFYACLLSILLFHVLALPCSSPVCYLCKDILKRSYYLTSNDGLLNKNYKRFGRKHMWPNLVLYSDILLRKD